MFADVHFGQCGLQVAAWAVGVHHGPYCLIHVCLLRLRASSNLQSMMFSMQNDVQNQENERCCIASGECLHSGVSPSTPPPSPRDHQPWRTNPSLLAEPSTSNPTLLLRSRGNKMRPYPAQHSSAPFTIQSMRCCQEEEAPLQS